MVLRWRNRRLLYGRRSKRSRQDHAKGNDLLHCNCHSSVRRSFYHCSRPDPSGRACGLRCSYCACILKNPCNRFHCRHHHRADGNRCNYGIGFRCNDVPASSGVRNGKGRIMVQPFCGSTSQIQYAFLCTDGSGYLRNHSGLRFRHQRSSGLFHIYLSGEKHAGVLHHVCSPQKG